MITIIIDDREKGIISELQNESYDVLRQSIKVERLDLGDIIIKYNGNDCIIIERKTLHDLSSSIKDGRYKEQKNRLLNYKNYNSKCKIIYLLEEFIAFDVDRYRDSNFKFDGILISSLKSVFINTMFRDDCNVVQTNDISDSCCFLLTLSENIKKNPSKFFDDQPPIDLIHECSLKKKKVTSENILQHQIACIPGIGLKQAKLILETFSNVDKMSTFIETLKDNKELLLSVKGIGKKSYKSICEMLGIK